MCKNIAMGKRTLTSETCSAFEDNSEYIKMPCKVGTTIWVIIDELPQFGGKYVRSEEVLEVSSNGRIWTDGCEYDTDDIGKLIFLTEAEAEQALKERENNG